MANEPPAQTGRVFLVGAGPGDPGLITVRAVECLRNADLVVYDRLVNPRLLDHAPHAERICVTDVPGPYPVRCGQVTQLLIDAAKQAKQVVRLKGGDPFIFGRGGEEAAALKAAGIPYEIVPGVTAGLAAAGFAGIPLTQRGLSSAVAFVTGHECPGKEESHLDWAALAKFPGTIVCYMVVGHLRSMCVTLIANDKPDTTPVAVVEWASMGQQRTIEGTLATIADQADEAQLVAPAVALIGPVVELRSTLRWFENKPLFGRTVLVTRPIHQAEGIVRRLEYLGATVHTLPLIEIGPPRDLTAVDRVINNLSTFDWLVFTSVNGVRAFFDRLIAIGRDLRSLGSIKLAAIGPSTAEELHRYHLHADLVPREFRSENLLQELLPHVQGKRVLLARADRGRALLYEELRKVAAVEQVAVYSQLDGPALPRAIGDLLRKGKIDFVTLTSSNIARSFARLLDSEMRLRVGRETQVVTISPVTSATVRELGLAVAAEATVFTAEGLVQAVAAQAGHFSSRAVSQEI